MADIGTAAPIPDWLKKAWAGARQRGVDTLTQDEIDAEIAAHRCKTQPRLGGELPSGETHG